ncbi:MAG: nucleotide synthetase [Phenylobacterium sp.]
MAGRTIGSDNKFGTIPLKTDESWNPIGIAHFLLGFEANKTTGRAEFYAKPVWNTYEAKDVDQYAQYVLDGSRGKLEITKTPFDIGVENQTFIMLELAPEINWQFARGEYGCTTKGEPTTDNFGLWHIHRKYVERGPISRDGCRLVYFGLARRKGYEGQAFNLHVEFLQDDPDDVSEPKRLPVIFDPDVGNNGGFPIPPDPPPPPPPPKGGG